MKIEELDVVRCCKKHSQRKIQIGEKEHVLAALSAEGHKRVESFLFEGLFESHLGDEVTGTSGWLFQYDNDDVPAHWFRLVTEKHPWRDVCDGELLTMLRERDLEITRVFLSEDGTGFTADRFTDGSWSKEKPLDGVLSELLERETPQTTPRNYSPSSIDGDRQTRAIREIGKQFDTQALTHLCAQRLLVNCHLWPWYHGQPMDIDSLIISDDGLRFVEFKRKYPTRRGTFGIDQHPHGVFIDWLNRMGKPLLHVLLVDPLWEKKESPLHLLENDSPTSEYASWIGVELDSGAFRDEGGFRTQGSDSGMFGGNRRQREIDPESTVLLGEGLSPSRLSGFLQEPDRFETRNLIEYMRGRRDDARWAYF